MQTIYHGHGKCCGRHGQTTWQSLRCDLECFAVARALLLQSRMSQNKKVRPFGIQFLETVPVDHVAPVSGGMRRPAQPKLSPKPQSQTAPSLPTPREQAPTFRRPGESLGTEALTMPTGAGAQDSF